MPLWLFFKSKQVGKGRERENIKIIVPFRFNPTRNRKLKKIAKKFKKIKNTVMYSFQAKIGLIKRREEENKNHRSVPFLPDAKLKIPKKQQ